MSKFKPSAFGTFIKVGIMILALGGVFWMMSRLRSGALNPVTNQLLAQPSEAPSERTAKVVVGQAAPGSSADSTKKEEQH